MALSAVDEHGKPVDWWFLYKVAGRSTTSAGAKLGAGKISGAEYIYFDARTKRKLALSAATVERSGALPNTLKQIYGSSNKDHGWFFYNDEDPIDGKVSRERGHTKGVLAFDLATNTAFWLIQSTPKFPPKGQYGFPRTGMPNAQTMLCITLADADVARSIAKQMYVAQQPNVYLASDIPTALAGQPNDARVKLLRNQVARGNTPVHVVIPFTSKGGVKFMSIAKNRTWGLDFYNDLVGPTLNENLDVETWEHDPVPPARDDDNQHTVLSMKEVNLMPLGVDLAWSEEADHAKLAISARDEEKHYVCVGDINYTIAQRKRGGGTVAFQCEALWASISSILEDTAEFPGTRAKAKSKAKSKSKSKAKTKSKAKSKSKAVAKRTSKPAARRSAAAPAGRRGLTSESSSAGRSVSRRTRS